MVANSTSSRPGQGPLPVDELPLVKPVEALGERVVEAVAIGADRGDDGVGGEPFRVADAEVLDALSE
jgi:hypothetical protein